VTAPSEGGREQPGRAAVELRLVRTADVDDGGQLNVTGAVGLLGCLLLSTLPPPPPPLLPMPDCVADPIRDELF